MVADERLVPLEGGAMRRSTAFVAAFVVLAVLALGTPATTADPAENSVTH
jgi:hypothetical protein